MFPALLDIPETLRSAGAAAPLVSVGLMVLHTLVPFPSEVLTVANGAVFGPLLGFALSWTGAMLGAYLGFGIARLGGRPLVQRIAGAKSLERLDRLVGAGGTWGLITARLLPVVSFNLVNYAAGLLSIDVWTFTWTTAIGIVPITAAMVWLGGAILHGGVLLWWTVGVFAVAVTGVVVVRMRHGNRAPGGKAAGDRAPGDRAPGDRAPGDRAPGDRASGDRAPGDRASGDRDET